MPTIRPAAEADLDTCRQIYAHWVATGTGSFELDPPVLAELKARHQEVTGRGLPWLVAVDDGDGGSGVGSSGGAILGYAYANWFRPRLAYRFTAETSIYVDPAHAGRGLGRALLAELLARCEATGIRQALAVIGDSDNAASIAVHAALGFQHVGTMPAVGWKFDRWLDVVIMQKALGPGATTGPA